MIFGALQHHFILNTFIYLFHVPQIHHTKWHHLVKVNY